MIELVYMKIRKNGTTRHQAAISEDFLNKYTNLLSNAFISDPLYTHSIPKEEFRIKKLAGLFKSTLNYGLLFGRINIIPGKGIAVWLSPGEQKITMGRAFQAGMFTTPFIVGFTEIINIANYSTIAERMHHRLAPDPHWYLFLLGVDPLCQGLGYGGKLIKPILELADQQKIPCYLDTCNPAAINFYKKHGFVVKDEVKTPISGFYYWGLRREV
ncbi:MAG: GNAT family N-acetyltransferase [Chloroflexota bacterium]